MPATNLSHFCSNDDLAAVKLGDSIPSEGGRLVVNSTSLDAGIFDRTGDKVVTGFIATADGRPLLSEWHRGEDGPEADDAVFFERWQADSIGRFTRVSHGWLDPATRKITQTG